MIPTGIAPRAVNSSSATATRAYQGRSIGVVTGWSWAVNASLRGDWGGMGDDAEDAGAGDARHGSSVLPAAYWRPSSSPFPEVVAQAMRTPSSPWPSLGLNLPYVEGSMDGATPRWPDIAAMAQAAEDAGFDAVWVSDHVGFGDPDTGWSGAWESWTLLSALAVATQRVRLGTYVTAVPYRNPALLAKMAETLDEVSGGRVILALGAGWNEPEFSGLRLPMGAALRPVRGWAADHHVHAPDRARGPRWSRRLGARGPGPAAGSAPGRPARDGWRCGAADAPPGRRARRRVERRDAHARGSGADAGRARGRLRGRWSRPIDDQALGGGDGGDRGAGRPRRRSRCSRVLGRAAPGLAAEIAAGLRRYRDLGMDHVQVQLRPNRVESVRAFGPVIEALRADG